MVSYRRIVWALAAVVSGSCSPAPSGKSAVLHDLAALAPAAEVRREVGTIDFGTAAARPHLIHGWYRNERHRDGSSVVWSRGEESILDFFLTQPRDLRAEIRCAPWQGFAGTQVIEFELNGREVGELKLGRDLQTYTVAFTGSAFRAGTNRLKLSYRQVSPASQRRLAVQWDVLRFRPARQPAAEAPKSEGRTVSLPYGSALVYYLELPGDGELVLPKIEARGSGQLAVSARLEDGTSQSWQLAPGKGRRAALPGSGPRLLRLELAAVSIAPDAAGGLRLQAPAVLGTRAEPEPRTANSKPPSGDRPNVIVYLVDTLRADRLGSYGSTKATSPAIDAFAAGATLFEHAVAQSSWTRPSVASILTGLTPLEHGARTVTARLPEEIRTLPEILGDAGYRTAGFSTNPHVSADTGLAQGFEAFQAFSEDSNADGVNRRVLRWLDSLPPASASKKPLFLYIHTIDPHAPYQPPADLAQRLAPGIAPAEGRIEEVRQVYLTSGADRARRLSRLAALYDAEVAASDRGFGELLAALRARGLYENSLIVFVADHGEEFDEHGIFGHGANLFGETLDVPLIVKWPGQREGRRVAHPAQQIDVTPTVLSATGLHPGKDLSGIDLALLAAAPARAAWPGRRVFFSHLEYEGRSGVSAVQGPWKLVLPLSRKMAPAAQLYRRDADPGERENRLEREAIRAGWLQAQIRGQLLRARPAAGQAGEAPIGEEARKALAALGYQ